MLIARDRKGLEPPLSHVPGGAVAPMITPHVRGQQPLQITRKLPLGPGPEDQMKVIRHEAKPKHPHRHALAGRPQQREKAAIVRLIVKDLGAGIAAVQHVVAQTTDGSSCGAGHAGSVGTPGGSRKKVECPHYSTGLTTGDYPLFTGAGDSLIFNYGASVDPLVHMKWQNIFF